MIHDQLSEALRYGLKLSFLIASYGENDANIGDLTKVLLLIQSSMKYAARIAYKL